MSGNDRIRCLRVGPGNRNRTPLRTPGSRGTRCHCTGGHTCYTATERQSWTTAAAPIHRRRFLSAKAPFCFRQHGFSFPYDWCHHPRSEGFVCFYDVGKRRTFRVPRMIHYLFLSLCFVTPEIDSSQSRNLLERSQFNTQHLFVSSMTTFNFFFGCFNYIPDGIVNTHHSVKRRENWKITDLTR